MEADQPTEEAVSLREVRARFVDAEEHLRRIAVSIDEATAAGIELRESQAVLETAARALDSVAAEVRKAATGFADHDAALARAIELLAAADPAAVREEIALLKSLVTESRESSSAQLKELASQTSDLGDELRSRTDQLRTHSRFSLALAVLAVIGVVTVLVVSLLP